MNLHSIIEDIKHHTTAQQVKWTRPTTSFVKVNSDGNALTNPGRIGGGAIIRHQLGEFIQEITSPLGEGTNNLAEIEAALMGI